MSLPYREQIHCFLIQINGEISVEKVRRALQMKETKKILTSVCPFHLETSCFPMQSNGLAAA